MKQANLNPSHGKLLIIVVPVFQSNFTFFLLQCRDWHCQVPRDFSTQTDLSFKWITLNINGNPQEVRNPNCFSSTRLLLTGSVAECNKNQHKNRQSFNQIDITMKFLYFETHCVDKIIWHACSVIKISTRRQLFILVTCNEATYEKKTYEAQQI